MKRNTIIYWVITILFAGFMLFTALPEIMLKADAVTFIANLGYPAYFVRFLGITKILGAIVILIPFFPRLKEWAYAGLFFDLAGATYSLVAVNGFVASELFMLIFIGALFFSYFMYHKVKRGNLLVKNRN